MKELILVMARALVDKPDEVEIKEIEGDVTTILELKVAKEDLGKVIGKQGKTAHAMRSILNATATKLKKRAVLEIVEQENGLDIYWKDYEDPWSEGRVEISSFNG